MSKLILLDQDNVLADFEKGIRNKFAKAYPNLPLNKPRTQFGWSHDYPEYKDEIVATYTAKGFYGELEPIQGAIDAAKELLAFGHDVRICTSPLSQSGQYTHCVPEKYDWVERHLGVEWLRRLILTNDKTWVRGDILVDDKPVITGSFTPTWEHWHYLQDYNANLPSKKVVWTDRASWADLLKRDSG